MGTTITFRRGENDPISGSGLTLAEPAFNTTLKTFHIGLGHGVTAAWVGAPISGLSADIAAGITYKIPSAAAVKNYIGGLCYGNTGAPTITQYVSSFNGLTGAVGGVCAAQANTFTALQGFSQGIVVDSGLTAYTISVNGGEIRNTEGPLEVSSTFGVQSGIAFDVYGNSTIASNNNTVATFNENSVSFDVPVLADYGLTASTLNVTGNAVVVGNLTVSGGVTFTISENVLIEDNIITLNSNVTGSPSENAGIEIERGTSANVQLLWNESSDKWTFTNDGSTYYDLPTSVVTSFNGNTGAVQGVSSAAAGTGISVSAATGAITITNIGVQSFNGNTGAVQGVSSVNGSTGAVITYAGTTGQIQFRYGSGVTANANLLLQTESGNAANEFNQFVFAGRTFGGGQGTVYGNVQSKGLFVDRLYDGAELDNGGAVEISALGLYEDGGGTTWGSHLFLTTQSGISDGAGGEIHFLPKQSLSMRVTSSEVSCSVPLFSGSTFTADANSEFVGTITGATATFSRLTTHSGGISAAGGTFSALTRFTAGISSAGGTFTQETRFASGLSASVVKTLNLSGYGGLSPSFIDGQFRLSQLMGTFTTVLSSGSTDRSITLPDADGTVALTSQLMGAVNGSTAATTAVTSFNGRTGAVTGASLGANTFTGLNSFNAGVSATGLTVGGSEGIEITRRLPAGAIIGEVNFLKGLCAELRVGNISGSVMVFNGSTASVFSPNYSLTISKGAPEGDPISGNYAAAVRFDTQTGFDTGTATLAPVSGYTTDRTINLPNANGTVALTSQLMGAVNGSTAATTAVTSFNGRTGAVTGASLGANTFTELNTFNAGISVSGGATFASTVRIVGTLSGTGATFSGGVSAAAFNGVAMNTGNDTFTNASLAIGAFALASNNGGYNNTAVGWGALSLNTTGTENAAFGESALTNCTTGSSNVAFGAGTLYENTFGSFNLAIGAQALNFMNGGNRNTAIGSGSLQNGSTGSDQIGIGYRAGSLVEGGLRNVAIGNEAMLGTATPVFYDCVSVGYRSLYSMSAAGASFNTAIGTESMRQTTSGSRNTGVGSNSLRSITTANEVIGIGADAGRYRGATGTTTLTTGTGGIYIGVDSRASGLAQTNEIVIGRSAVGLGSNTAVIGATAQTAAYIYGLVHAVGGVSAPGGTFSALTRFTAGISAAGGVTFSGTIASDTGYRITSNAINAQTGTTYTFLDSDNGKVVTFNNGSTTTVTIPTGLPVGFNCTAIQLGAGQVGFTAASGVTMNAYASVYKISGQHGAAALISYTTNIFNLSGTLSA